MSLLSARIVLVGCLCLSGSLFPAVPVAAQGAGADPVPQEPRRPAALPPLYVSFAALQAMDIASTRAALRDGAARDLNPLIQAMHDSTAATIAFKAGITTAVVLATERLRKQHPKAAVLFMIGLNSAYAVVVAHNYSIAGPRR